MNKNNNLVNSCTREFPKTKEIYYFSINQTEEDKKNGFNLQKTIIKYFYDDKVLLELYQEKYYEIEFKGEGDSTLFKVFLKPAIYIFYFFIKTNK